MIGRILKWFGIGFGGTLVIIVVLVGIVSTIRWHEDYENIDVQVDLIDIPTGDEAVRRGKHLAATHYCGHCHGELIWEASA